ncbi:hypothetical protein E2C01_043291 [Portunus trituberculatus]|uniref:Uncharacterized protein n=1 Tax=Portunus trituberculatus TaxID=210409 RepID=A0A5B7FVX8_PORTR|nr:hypothetical protein [Portunus trituberculatus]
MRQHPLKVDVVSKGGQVEDEVMDDEGESVVVGFYYLEDRFYYGDGGSGWQPPGSDKEPGGNVDGCTDGWRVSETGAISVDITT